MAAIRANFDKYTIYYYSSHTLNAYYDCLIYCFSGTTYVGRIEFHKEATAEETLKSSVSSGKPTVKYRLSRFRDVTQILLHEKPLYIFVNEANGIGGVCTDEMEPVGEEEP